MFFGVWTVWVARVIACVLVLGAAACAGAGDVDPRFADSLEAPYRLDSGDRLRVIVFGQTDLTNSYTVDPEGMLAMPLIGAVPARGHTLDQLDAAITHRLQAGFLRDPNVTLEIAEFRPFFVLGEVQAPGRFPYVAGMTARTAVAIAGGFTPRSVKRGVTISRQIDGVIIETDVPLDHPIRPGDTVTVHERWL